jgi:hypothetical protein
MAEGKVYNIPAAGFEWFKTKMETLAKRAKRLTGERLFLTVVGFHKEEDTSSSFHGQRIQEVFVAFPEPKLAGWEFVARIDHGHETGNIVRATGLRDLPTEYRDSDPVCDHCGHKRRRRDTFVVFNEETNSYKQVGSSCLKDFLGHGDADKWAKMAELIASIGEFATGSRNTGFTGYVQDHRWIGTEMFLEMAAESILERGFTSKKTGWESGRKTTSEDAFARMSTSLHIPSEAARNLAQAARDWAQGLTGDLSDYEHNCYVVANSEGLEPRSLGIAASIVGVYYSRMAPKGQASGHMGVVGERLEIEVTVDEVRTLEFSFLHKMHDGFGNSYTWFATKPLLRPHLGKSVRIKGSVKKHDEFKGNKTTLLTRVTLAK